MREGLVEPFSSPTTDTCRQEFGSSLYCPACVRFLIKDDIDNNEDDATNNDASNDSENNDGDALLEKLGHRAGLSRRGREDGD